MTDDDLIRLDALLERDPEAEAIDSVEMLDGFFCALIAAGGRLEPEDWLGVVWPDDHPFDSAKQRAEAHGLARTFFDEVRRRSDFEGDTAGEEHLPIVALPGDEDSLDLIATDVPVGADWAVGFDLGMAHRAEAWETMLEAIDGLDAHIDAIDELLRFDDGGEGEDPAEGPAPTLERRMAILASVPYLMRDLVQGQREAD